MDYSYAECGLDNVVIHGMSVPQDDAGEPVYHIRNVLGLHHVLACCIVRHEHGISPKELRFLRTEMGMTQHELAEILKKDHQTVGRWERGEKPIDQTAEVVLRRLAIERLSLEIDMPMEELARRCMPSAKFQVINIDGSDPENYRAMPIAA